MKFYVDEYNFTYHSKIIAYRLTAIRYTKYFCCYFYKNGNFHNNKNAAFIYYSGVKYFYLNEKGYGDHNNFTKKSWRKFVKLITFI
jgi:hypothetical protein